MITNIRLFRESLSKDVQFDTKKRMLMEKIQSLINVKAEIDLTKSKLSEQHGKVNEVLKKMNTHSIICNGILIETYGAFKSNRFDSKSFFETLETSVDTLGKDVLDIANKYKDIYEYEVEMKFTKGLANGTKAKAPRPHGDYTQNEGFNDIVGKVGSFFSGIFSWARSFFRKAEKNLIDVQNNLASIGINVSITESLNENIAVDSAYLMNMRNVDKLIKTSDLSGYIKNSKYKRHIINVLSTISNATFKQLHVNPTYSGSSNTLSVLVELIFCGFVVRKKQGAKKYIYNLTVEGYDLLNKNNITITISEPTTTATQAESETSNKVYDPSTPIKVQKPTFDTSYVAEALDYAKDAITLNKAKLSLETEEQMLKEDIIKLFDELNLLEIVVDDKIHKMYTQKRTYLNAPEFQKAITDAEEVGEEISDLMIDLVSQHVKEFETSGSTRQFADNSGLADGTLGAHFDHETKQVVMERMRKRNARIKRINENIFKKAWNWIKSSIKRIINTRKNVEQKLAQI